MSGSEISGLEQVLQAMCDTGEDDRYVYLLDIVPALGQRGFGSLLLVPGLVAASPLSGIPGVPTTMGLLAMIIAAQMAWGRAHVWLPEWLLRRKVARSRLRTALDKLRPVARFFDKLVRPRLPLLTGRLASRILAVICVAVAATMPPLELVPFAATSAGTVLAMFGLALMARDGALVVVGLALLSATAALAVMNLA
jgi:hypothetical protein